MSHMAVDYTKNAKFSKKSTTTIGKLETIQWQNAIIAEYRRQRGGKFKGALYGLPGGEFQCERHINEYLGYDIREQHQHLIEIDPATQKGQKRWAKKRGGFKGHFHLGNGFEVIEQALDAGRRISIVDWDDTRALLCDHVRLLRRCAKGGVDVIILVLTTRGVTTERLRKEKRRFKMRRRWTVANGGRLSDPSRDITVRAVERYARLLGYDCHNRPYFGRQPMISFVLTRKYQ